MDRSRHGFLTGAFPISNFTQPTMGTEGNEEWGQLRNPGFAETDAALQKDTKLTERLRMELRLEFFNLFNRVNLGGVQGNPGGRAAGRDHGSVERHVRPRDLAVESTVDPDRR
jgi:hypothetical protein